MSAHHETQIYSAHSASAEGDRISNAKHAAPHGGLHSEAINHLSGPSAKSLTDKGTDSGKFMPTNGDYWVIRGDNLYKIAQRSLVAQGKDHPDGRSIYSEIDRIVELNLKYYPKLKDHRLEPGMILAVENKAQSAQTKTNETKTNEAKPNEAKPNEAKPSESKVAEGKAGDAKPVESTRSAATSGKGYDQSGACTDQTWKFAEPGTITTAQKCDLVFAGADSKVVVHPGGQAMLQRGSSGFVFKGGQATVMEGATVIDAGGSIELQPGAKFVDIKELSRQAQIAAQMQADAEAQAQVQAQTRAAANGQAGTQTEAQAVKVTTQQEFSPQG